MEKLYDIYSNEVFKYTDKDEHFLSIYTVSEYLNEDESERESRLEELEYLNSDFKENDIVLSPYNLDISLYNEDEFDKAFIDFFDNDFSMLKKVIEEIGVAKVIKACKDEEKSLELIQRLFNLSDLEVFVYRRMSRYKLSQVTGIPYSTLTDYLEDTSMTFDNAYKIAKALDISLDELYELI